LTEETIGDTFLELRLFDANTGENIKHTSMFVTVDKDGELLMRDLFHTHSGDLLLKIQPKEMDVNDVVVFGDVEPYLRGWMSANDQISVTAPILLEAGLYHFEIEIFGIDFDKNIFTTADAPKFESWLSVADIFEESVSSQGKTYDTPITSYYDKITDFNFDDSTKTITWSMLFNWDLERLQSQNVFVHQEIHFPSSFSAFTKATSYDASVNGIPLVGREIIADPYSIEDTLILHYLLSKDKILQVAESVPENSHTMNFKLAPGGSEGLNENMFDINLESGAVVKVSYDKKFGAGDDIPLKLTFFGPDEKLLKYVRHGFRIADDSGNVIYEDLGNDTFQPGIVSTEGIDIQTVNLQNEGNYELTVAIFSTGQDVDKSLSGIGSSKFTVGPSNADSEQSNSKDTSSENEEVAIPDWIKNNAAWWADGQIDDNSFVQGIQYLIKEGIMKIPPTAQGTGSGGNEIPEWIKNNAAWWADGQIDDNSFVQGIQYLIKEGIMKIVA
ncbi:MAG: peptidase, partial [Nitrosopumilaceae archaeon]